MFLGLTVPPHGAMHVMSPMRVETRFLWLCRPAVLGEHIDGWRVCWLGGWDKCRVFFVVMVERQRRGTRP